VQQLEKKHRSGQRRTSTDKWPNIHVRSRREAGRCQRAIEVDEEQCCERSQTMSCRARVTIRDRPTATLTARSASQTRCRHARLVLQPTAEMKYYRRVDYLPLSFNDAESCNILKLRRAQALVWLIHKPESIGRSKIFLEGGDFGKPSERSERALTDLARGGAQNDIELSQVTRIIII